jgi:hypothetical protein
MQGVGVRGIVQGLYFADVVHHLVSQEEWYVASERSQEGKKISNGAPNREEPHASNMGWRAAHTLCSPSPGTSGPLTKTLQLFFYMGSVCYLYCIHFLIASLSFNMKLVPGVVQLESNASLSGRAPSRARIMAVSFSASFDKQKLLERC